MTDQQLRELVRVAVARHLGQRSDARGPALDAPVAGVRAPRAGRPAPIPRHPSHGLYLALLNSGDACVIEPSVPCDHCSYCKSHGH